VKQGQEGNESEPFRSWILVKRISRKQIIYNERVRAKKERKKAKRRRNSRKLRSLRKNSRVITAPRAIALYNVQRRKGTLSFLDKLRKAVYWGKEKAITIDFSHTETCISDGTLLLKSELFRLKKHLRGTKQLRCIPPTSGKIQQVLKQVGIFKMLAHESSVTPTRDDVTHWKYAHGNEVDGSKYDDVLGHYEGQLSEPLATGLFKGITEAMTNCHHHAYEGIRDDGLNINDPVKDWWMFSQKKDGMLSVVFCDLGIGIPRSLPAKKPGLWKTILSGGMGGKDGEIINEAIKHSRTRTGFKHRGKGLRQLADTIDFTPGATLMIYSNKGCYTLRHGEEAKVHEYRNSMFGTLIMWQLPLEHAPSGDRL